MRPASPKESHGAASRPAIRREEAEPMLHGQDASLMLAVW
jgi:hypothetical protein